MGKYKKGELQREKLYISMRRQSSSIPSLWDGSIHSKSASPVAPRNQGRSHSIRAHWEARGHPWAGSWHQQSLTEPQHCMAGAAAGPGQGLSLAPPPVGSCSCLGSIFRASERQQWGFVLVCLTYRTMCPSASGDTGSPNSSSKPRQKMMFSRVQGQRRGL